MARALKLIEWAGVVRSRELTAHGIQRVRLQRLEQRGLIERAGRGLYRLTGENYRLEMAGKRGLRCRHCALRVVRIVNEKTVPTSKIAFS